MRCLDQYSLNYYVTLSPELKNKEITHASISDILRINLLKEYGGVWVDATAFCNKPLDSWLENHLQAGFFAFHKPAPDRLISSWFLAATEHNPIVDHWHSRVNEYWQERSQAHHYFWFHYIFGELYDNSPAFRETFEQMPKLSARPSIAIHTTGFSETDVNKIEDGVDWETPVFKLSYRYKSKAVKPGSLLTQLIGLDDSLDVSPTTRVVSSLIQRLKMLFFPVRARQTSLTTEPQFERDSINGEYAFGSLKVSTENLGDHIQIIAATKLLERYQIKPTHYIDRDNEISKGPIFSSLKGRLPILINGWFKNNREEWPPNELLSPLFLGFHIRLHQCPALVSDEAITYYKNHEPIGCRDPYTQKLLETHGVTSFETNCLTLSFAKRRTQPEKQKKVFVVSRDEEILRILPDSLGEVEFISHYSGSNDFEHNMKEANKLLERYRDEAALIITSLLHCALPAIALGIPVVVFFPKHSEKGHQSDTERMSGLAKLVRIYHFDEVDQVDWNPGQIPTAVGKLHLIDSLAFSMHLAGWPMPEIPEFNWVAPSSALPPQGIGGDSNTSD